MGNQGCLCLVPASCLGCGNADLAGKCRHHHMHADVIPKIHRGFDSSCQEEIDVPIQPVASSAGKELLYDEVDVQKVCLVISSYAASKPGADPCKEKLAHNEILVCSLAKWDFASRLWRAADRTFSSACLSGFLCAIFFVKDTKCSADRNYRARTNRGRVQEIHACQTHSFNRRSRDSSFQCTKVLICTSASRRVETLWMRRYAWLLALV